MSELHSASSGIINTTKTMDNDSFNFNDFKHFQHELNNCDQSITSDKNSTELKNEKTNWRYCLSCNVEAIEDIIQSRRLICPKCGMEIQNINDDEVNYYTSLHYNTMQLDSVSTKIEGKNSYAHNKSLRGTCSDYNAWNSKKAIKHLNKCSYESETDKIPPCINEIVVKEFEKIRKRKTFRGPVQIGIKAVLAYYICPTENIIRKPSEMAKLHGILERDLSRADSIVREFIEEGVIDIPVNQNNHITFVERYTRLLKIDDRWKSFILDILERAEKKHLYANKSPKLSTKCVGTIYLVINSIPSLKKRISKDDIVSKCNISKTTFINQYQLLLANKKKLKKVFKKYGIEFPEE